MTGFSLCSAGPSSRRPLFQDKAVDWFRAKFAKYRKSGLLPGRLTVALNTFKPGVSQKRNKKKNRTN